MSENTYNYNPETLGLEQQKESKLKRVFRFLIGISIPAILIALALIFVLPYFAQTSQQKVLMQQERILKEHFDALLEKKEISDQYLNEIREKDRQIYELIFEAQLQDPATKQRDIYMQMQSVKPSRYTDKNSKILDSLHRAAANLENETQLLHQIIASQQSELDYIPAIQPLYNPEMRLPVYGFGTLIDPVYKTPAFHTGIDYAAPQGTPIFATANGQVIFSGRKRAKGMMVEIDHGNGYLTQYAHMNEIKVRNRAYVERGDVLGYVGNTGKSFVDHLHYEIRYEGVPINPVNYFFLDLSIEQYSQMLDEVMKAGISLD